MVNTFTLYGARDTGSNVIIYDDTKVKRMLYKNTNDNIQEIKHIHIIGVDPIKKNITFQCHKGVKVIDINKIISLELYQDKPIIGQHYHLNHDRELRQIEKDLKYHLKNTIFQGKDIFVKCNYDTTYSHKHYTHWEKQNRKDIAIKHQDYSILDYRINYEIYEQNQEARKHTEKTLDGKTYQIHYVKGHGGYIIIIDVEKPT